MAKTMAVRPATSSIYSGSPESTPFKKPSAVEIFKIHNTTTEISKYSEIFSEDDLFKPPIDSTTNTSSFNDEEDEDFSSIYTEEEQPDQLFALPPIRDEWRTLFDLFDPEGFGEIPLADFELALESREFITHISPGKLIILKDKLLAHQQMGDSAITFQEFVNTLSGKRTLSFKCAVHSKDKQVSQPGDFHLRREDSIFSISDRLTEVLAKETLTDDLDRKWFLNTRGPCCLWPPPCLLLVISVAQIILYLYNSVAEHPLVLHPIKFHEPWRYITYFLVHVDLSSLLVNLFVQLAVGLPLEVVHGSFRIGLIYGCGILYGSLASSIFDPSVRLAGASGPAYAMLSAHLANVILHHASMSSPFLRLTGLLLVASLEVGFGIYRRYRYAPPDSETPQISFAAHLAGVVAGLTFGLVILKNYEQKLSERRVWWLTLLVLFILSFTAFLYQRLRPNPALTLFCVGHRCPPPNS